MGNSTVLPGIIAALQPGPKDAEGILVELKKSKCAPAGDALGFIRFFLAFHRDIFEKVPGKVGVYRLLP